MSIQPVTYPDINGNRYSFASIEALFEGIVVAGFKAIDYSSALEPADVYGTAPEKIGRTRGKAQHEASFEMYKEEYENLRIRLGAVGYMERPFTIIAIYAELGKPPITDTLIGVRITKDQDTHADGTDALTTKVTCNVMRVQRGGVDRATYPIPTL